jgi:hypothetical protein
MKSLLLGLLIVSLSTATMAATFTTDSEVTVQSGSYSLPKTIKVQVLDVNPHTDTAEIKVNDEVKTYNLRFLRSDSVGYENVYTYSASLGSKILSDGSSCQEYEAVSFKLILSVEDEPRDPHTPATFSAVSLSALYSYNWDVCHGEMETKVINYKK